jgi:hypothetical protein
MLQIMELCKIVFQEEAAKVQKRKDEFRTREKTTLIINGWPFILRNEFKILISVLDNKSSSHDQSSLWYVCNVRSFSAKRSQSYEATYR